MTLDEACKKGREMAIQNKRLFVYIRNNDKKGYYPSIIPGKDAVYKLSFEWKLEEINKA